MHTSKVEELSARLKEMGVTALYSYVGLKPASKEALAEEILKSLDALDHGDYDLPSETDLND